MTTLCQLLQRVAAEFSSKTAVLTQRGYRIERWSYQYLWEFSERLATYLRGKGLKHGDRLLLWAPNMPEWIGLYFGCLRAGVILVPIDMRSTPDFAVKVKEKTSASYLFVSQINQEQGLKLGISTQCLEDLSQELDGVSSDSGLPSPAEEDIAEVMFTSGTTGEPKGVILTHRNIVSNVLASAQVISIGASSRVLSFLPLSHMLEQTAELMTLLKFGATVVYPASQQPRLIFRTLKEQRITTIVVVPQILQLFWNAIEREVKKQGREQLWQHSLRIASHLPMKLRRLLFRSVHRQLGGSLQLLICGGAYLDPELARCWELLGIPVLQGYGTTEAAPIVTVNPLKGRRLDSVGKVLPGQDINIIPDGEVLIRGANVTPGYWQDPEATEVAFEEGWYRTGDLGYLDNEGYLYLRGRKKDMIALASGMNVYAQDVEKALKACSGVKDACVLGVPTKRSDVQVHAVLLLQETEISPEEIVEQANKHLVEHQRVQVSTVWPFPEFPLTHTLKIKKQEVLDYILSGALAKEPASVVPTTGKASEVPVLHRLLADVTGVPVENISPSMSLGEELNLDSLGRVELLAAVESELDIYVDESQVSADTTVEELQALVSSEGEISREQGYLEWPLNRLVGLGRAFLQSFLIFPLLRLMAPLEVEGRDNLKGLEGPVLFASNHQSHMDTPVVLAAIPVSWRRRTTVAAAADFWFAGGLIKKLLAVSLFNAFPFSRTDAIRPTLEHCCQLLDRGWSILIYPEGTRSETGHMGLFRSGAGLMAVELGVPVVPIHIWGTYEVLPKNQSIPRRGRVHVCFGKALQFPLKTPYTEATEALEEAVKVLEGSRVK
ncbi:2-succinylbenzoate--CoA ligase [subsurface metagenome]